MAELSERAQTAMDRWLKAAHAMQSGVAFEMNKNPGPTEPKHLRVGVNTALSDMGGLVGLLIRKGVFTDEEYYEAIADKMEEEVRTYERRLTLIYGTDITLG